MDNIKEYIPGYLQGITRVLISYPFDYIRIFLQINNKDNIKQIIKANNLYKGVSSPLIIAPIDRAITFKLYETLKSKKFNNIECALYPSILSSIYMTPINNINYNLISLINKIFNILSKEIYYLYNSNNIYLPKIYYTIINNINNTIKYPTKYLINKYLKSLDTNIIILLLKSRKMNSSNYYNECDIYSKLLD